MLAKVGSTAFAKVLVMGMSGVLAVLTGRLIIQNFGTDAYAQYGLLSTLPSLLPVADLGIAAVILNAVAGSEDVRRDEFMRRTIVTGFRVLICSGAILVSGALAISFLGIWPAILGDGLLANGGSLTVFVCLTIFSLSLPLAVGQRIIVGLGRTTTQVAAQSVVAPFMLASIGLLVLLSVPAGAFLSIFSYIGLALVSIICLIMSGRSIQPQLGKALREIPFRHRFPGVPIFALAWPMLIQRTVMPLALQSDRILLSHLTDGEELADFNIAAQLFGMALQTIAAGGLALWPIYAKARARKDIQSPLSPTLWFLGGGTTLAVVLALAAPYLVDFMSDGKLVLNNWLIWGFVVYVGLQAAKYPTGMYMTDARGLRFQVLPIIIMMPISIGLSWYLIGHIGAGGAVIGSAVAVLCCQVIPNFWYVRRDLRRRRREEQESGEPEAAPEDE